MRFTIGGSIYEIDREDILLATKGILPKPFDGRYKYYVELHGSRYPIKQIIHLVTDLSYTDDFTAQYAHRILKKLGFTVSRRRLPVVGDVKPLHSTTSISDTVEGALKFAITLKPGEDGFIVASVPALPGCHSQGKTEEEAIANITEAIRGYIASMRRHGEPIPSITEVRQVEVTI